MKSIIYKENFSLKLNETPKNLSPNETLDQGTKMGDPPTIQTTYHPSPTHYSWWYFPRHKNRNCHKILLHKNLLADKFFCTNFSEHRLPTNFSESIFRIVDKFSHKKLSAKFVRENWCPEKLVRTNLSANLCSEKFVQKNLSASKIRKFLCSKILWQFRSLCLSHYHPLGGFWVVDGTTHWW
jgi:hypothetical protein